MAVRGGSSGRHPMQDRRAGVVAFMRQWRRNVVFRDRRSQDGGGLSQAGAGYGVRTRKWRRRRCRLELLADIVRLAAAVRRESDRYARRLRRLGIGIGERVRLYRLRCRRLGRRGMHKVCRRFRRGGKGIDGCVCARKESVREQVCENCSAEIPLTVGAGGTRSSDRQQRDRIIELLLERRMGFSLVFGR